LLKEDNYLNGWWISKTPEAQRSIPIISETLLKLFEKFFSKHKFCWEYYWDKSDLLERKLAFERRILDVLRKFL